MELGATVEIPVVVVAETVRSGPRGATVHRVLKAIGNVPAATESLGRLAGKLLGQAGSSSTVDALVVAQAIEAGGAQVLTGDPGDLEPLAASHPEVRIQRL
jgi:predicted nucleic acid-binding protein